METDRARRDSPRKICEVLVCFCNSLSHANLDPLTSDASLLLRTEGLVIPLVTLPPWIVRSLSQQVLKPATF
jgi:hypothetical protein